MFGAVALSRAVCTLDLVLTRHRTCAILLVAYIGFFHYVYRNAVNESSLPEWDTSGPALLDREPGGPLLSRETVLARAGPARPGGGRGFVLRREAADPGADGQDGDSDQDPYVNAVGVLKRALVQQSLAGGLHVARLHEALAGVYGLSARYHEAKSEAKAAVATAEALGDFHAAAQARIVWGHLELRYHKHHEAETCFQDALSRESTLPRDTRVNALAGAGWAAFLQGALDRAMARFRSCLILAQVSLAVDGSPAATRCKAHNDGLDGDRAIALSGLSLVEVRAAAGRNSTLRGSVPGDLVRCAHRIVHDSGATPQSRRALGLARLGLGELGAARRQHRLALAMESGITAHESGWDAWGVPHRTNCTTHLVACSHNALHMGLIDAVAGDAAKGASHIDRVLTQPTVVRKDFAEWLTAFGQAHLWIPGSPELMKLLLARATRLLEATCEDQFVRHLVYRSRLLRKLFPAELETASELLEQALQFERSCNLAWPKHDVASLHHELGSEQLGLGDSQAAFASLERSLQLHRVAIASGLPYPLESLTQHSVSLAEAILQNPKITPDHWRMAVRELANARRTARQSVMATDHAWIKSLDSKFWTTHRLAHRRGVYDTCLGPRDVLLFGPSCRADQREGVSALGGVLDD